MMLSLSGHCILVAFLVALLGVTSGRRVLLVSAFVPTASSFRKARFSQPLPMAVRPPPPIPLPPPPKPGQEFSFPFDLENVRFPFFSNGYESNPLSPSSNELKWDPIAARDAVDSFVTELKQNLFGDEKTFGTGLGDTSMSIQESIASLQQQIATFDANVLDHLTKVATDLEQRLVEQYPSLGPLYTKLTSFLASQLLQAPPSVTIFVTGVLSFWMINAVLTWGQPPPPTQPYPLRRYDPVSARQYFDRRLFSKVIPRGLYILSQSLQFGLRIWKDSLEYVKHI